MASSVVVMTVVGLLLRFTTSLLRHSMQRACTSDRLRGALKNGCE
jgi:hypothetical protein